MVSHTYRRASGIITPMNIAIKKPYILLFALCALFFIGNLNTNTSGVLAAELQRTLHLSNALLMQGLFLYALIVGSIVVIAGRLSDRYSPRPLVLTGAILYTLGSLCMSAAVALPFFWCAITLQALGTGLFWSCAIAAVPRYFTRNDGLAMGCVSAAGLLGLTLGPVLAHLAILDLNWRYFFLFEAIFTALASTLCWYRLPRPLETVTTPFDFFGTILLLLTCFFSIFSVVQVSVQGLTPNSEVSLLLLLVTLLLFIWRELNTKTPLLPLSSLANGIFFSALLARMSVIFAYVALLFFWGLVYSDVQGYSATKALLYFMPLGLIAALGAIIGGKLAQRFSVLVITLAGMLLLILGLWITAHVQSIDFNYWRNVANVVIAGIAIGFIFPSNNLVALKSLPKECYGMGAGILYWGSLLSAFISSAVCKMLAANGAFKMLTDNFVRLGVVLSSWQQNQLHTATQQFELSAYLNRHFSASLREQFVPAANHLYAFAFADALWIVIVAVLFTFSLFILITNLRK